MPVPIRKYILHDRYNVFILFRFGYAYLWMPTESPQERLIDRMMTCPSQERLVVIVISSPLLQVLQLPTPEHTSLSDE